MSGKAETEFGDQSKGLWRKIYALRATTGRRINNVSVGAEWLFWRLHCVADDLGVFQADPILVKSLAAPIKNVTPKEIESWIGELAARPTCLIRLYDARGDRYGRILDFDHLQKPRNGKVVSKHPPEFGVIQSNPENPGALKTETENKTETETENKTETETETGPRPRPRLGADGVGVGSVSGSDSDEAGGKESRRARADRELRECEKAIIKGDMQRACAAFASSVLLILKPRGSTDSDTFDLIALAGHLRAGVGTDTAWFKALREAFQKAQTKSETGGGYGAWRNAIKKKFGNWSVRT